MNKITCRTENLNTYPNGNRHEKDAFETANNSMVREGLGGFEILEISFLGIVYGKQNDLGRFWKLLQPVIGKSSLQTSPR